VIAGIGLAASAYFLFSLQDASIKWLAAGFSAPQILFMRSVAIVPFCLAIGGPNLIVRAAISPIRLQLVWRSLVLLAAWACYYSAARYLQLAEMTTIYFASPLLVAALAMPILKERVPWSRWLSIAIGFTGVMRIKRTDFGMGFLLAAVSEIFGIIQPLTNAKGYLTNYRYSIIDTFVTKWNCQV